MTLQEINAKRELLKNMDLTLGAVRRKHVAIIYHTQSSIFSDLTDFQLIYTYTKSKIKKTYLPIYSLMYLTTLNVSCI